MRFPKLNYTVLWLYYTGCTQKTKKNPIPLPKQLQSAWRNYCFSCAQNHAPVTKIPSRQTNATDRDSRADRTAARTVPIKNHGQDSSTLQFANIFLTYQTFVTNLHLLRAELRCKLPGKLHRVTGPLAHHVVLNHTFELLINTTMLFWYIWNEHLKK